MFRALGLKGGGVPGLGFRTFGFSGSGSSFLGDLLTEKQLGVGGGGAIYINK